MSQIHDRMPVIIKKSLVEKWLKESADVLKEALADLQFEPVSASGKNPSQLRLFT
jgi:putative SOS response-associated peptidase YedK